MREMWFSGVLCGIILSALSQYSAQAISVPLANQYVLTFNWNPSPDAAVAGYKIHYGTASGEYSTIADMGDVTSTALPGFVIGTTYYFAITAYDEDGEESAPSGEISYGKYVPNVQIQNRTAGKFTLNITGAPGQILDVEATTDLKTWTVIDTVTLDASGVLNFNDPNMAAHAKRFYRIRQQL